jgi:hypothetical protein
MSKYIVTTIAELHQARELWNQFDSVAMNALKY